MSENESEIKRRREKKVGQICVDIDIFKSIPFHKSHQHTWHIYLRKAAHLYDGVPQLQGGKPLSPTRNQELNTNISIISRRELG